MFFLHRFFPQTLFEPMFIAVYNVFYTSQPVLALGIFDQDVDEAHSLKYPRLYAPGLSSALFNKREFFKSALQGFIASCVLFFLSHGEPIFQAPFFDPLFLGQKKYRPEHTMVKLLILFKNLKFVDSPYSTPRIRLPVFDSLYLTTRIQLPVFDSR